MGSVARQSVFRLVVQGVMFIGATLTSIVVARLLGPEGRGMYALFSLVPGLVVTFGNIGVGQGILYHLAKKTYAKNEIWTFGLFFCIIWGFTVFLAAALIIRALPDYFLGLGGYRSLVVLGLATVPFQLWRICLSNFMLGLQTFTSFNLLDIVYVYAHMVLSVLLILNLQDRLFGAIVAWLIVSIALPVVTGIAIRDFTRMEFSRLVELTRAIVGYGIHTYGANLMQFFNYRLDAFIVNYFVGPVALGFYSIAVSISEVVWQISGASSTILYPKVASLDFEGANKLTPRVCRVSLGLSIISSLILAGTSHWLIRWLYSDVYNPSVAPLLLLLPGVAIFSIVRVLYNDLAGRGRPGVGSAITGFGLIATIGLDLLLIPSWGIVGAAIASSASYCMSALIAVFIFRALTGIPVLQLLIPMKKDLIEAVRLVDSLCLGCSHKTRESNNIRSRWHKRGFTG